MAGGDPFFDLLEQAPIPALLLDSDQLVIDANVAALELFPIDVKRLPLGIVEATREANLVTAVNSRRPKGDVRLTHGRRLVEVQVVSGPREDTQVVYVTDVTELRRLESVRQEFVANLAHELKTPITSLRLAVESQQQDMPPELRRRMSDRALREVDYLSLVISNLRQLSALDSSMGTSSPERFDVALLLDEVRERLRLKQPVKVSVPPGLWANADRARIAQALANLIDNASKFSPRTLRSRSRRCSSAATWCSAFGTTAPASPLSTGTAFSSASTRWTRPTPASAPAAAWDFPWSGIWHSRWKVRCGPKPPKKGARSSGSAFPPLGSGRRLNRSVICPLPTRA